MLKQSVKEHERSKQLVENFYFHEVPSVLLLLIGCCLAVSYLLDKFFGIPKGVDWRVAAVAFAFGALIPFIVLLAPRRQVACRSLGGFQAKHIEDTIAG